MLSAASMLRTAPLFFLLGSWPCWSARFASMDSTQFGPYPLYDAEVRDIVYADDHAACVTARDALHLVSAVSHVIGRSLDAITSHSLTANIGPRKTAALLVHRGKGAKAVRDGLFGRDRAKITALCEHSPPVQLDAAPGHTSLVLPCAVAAGVLRTGNQYYGYC
ncbi:hypothetical protein AK812_SmicGene13495 [Symbiodinium microadriaticum]|uniref:Reverse transcriptase domain-containing protein n=1 Tax=Symbiodinium microadriaticum TaxID=2951 RepID=A0A1Q9E803_SYMMI|nr:hypothetical protein AK812_SmicGene13495 [Symbiodinium microadriaticum]